MSASTYTAQRDFPQAKLDSEINARFISNEHGDLYFLLHEFGVTTILFKLKVKKLFGRKKNIAKRVHKSVTRGCKL